MAGLPRYTQKIFGLDAGSNQMSKYGSFLSTPELYSGATITPDIIQALSNFQGGIYDGVGGAYSPTIQDFNSLFRLVTQGLAYYFTRGIPEWDAGTTYNTNDICKVGPITYYSLIDSNTNNAPESNPSDWRSNETIAPTQQIFLTGSGTYTVPTSPKKPSYIRVQMCGGGGGGCGGVLGGGAGTSTGGDGGNSTFGVAQLTANGGEGSEIVSGSEYHIGAAGIASFTIGIGKTFIGSEGSCGSLAAPSTFAGLSGGMGGQNLLGGAGRGGGNTAPVKAGIANSGAGGGGGYAEAASGFVAAGAGGSPGGYLDVIIANPYSISSTFSYQIGAGGTAGTRVGTTAEDGAPGGTGVIIVTEYY